MEKLGLFLAQHPAVTGVFIAAVFAFSGWNAFQTGVTMERLRVLAGDADREASEALGG